MENENLPIIRRRFDALPSLPLALALRQRGQGGAGSSPEAERLALTDPALAVMVLRVANSPLYGRGGAVPSVEAALRLLGAGVVRRIAVGITGAGPGPAVEGLERHRYLEHSVAAAAACRSLAHRLGIGTPEEAHTAGLLHSLGRAVFIFGNAQKYASVLRQAAEEKKPLPEVERQVLGSDHGRAGALVAERWNLPTALRDVVAHHSSPGPDVDALPEGSRGMVQVVAAVNDLLAGESLATCCGNGLAAAPVVGRTVGGRKVRKEDAQEAIDAGRLALDDAARILGLTVSKDVSFADAVRTAFLEGARGEAPPPDPRIPRPDLAAVGAIVADSLREVRSLGTPEEAWLAGLRGIRVALGVDRVLFYAYDAERARLDLRHGIDDTALIRSGDKVPGDLPMAAGGPLSHAVRDGRATTADDLGADTAFLRGIGVSQIAAAPVDVLEKTHGLVVVDNLFSARDINAEDAALLGLLSGDLGLAIENLILNKQTAKLRSLAERDELTGVNNRRNLMALFQRELDRARRYGSALSVSMVDIDYFKSFNDTYGHQAGDEVLRTISQVLVAASREIDIIGRYGGEEFVALLPETNIVQARVYAERLRARVELRGNDLLTRFNRTRPLTISVGVTQANPAAGDDVERIIGRVDAALYEAKEAGRNRVIVAETSETE